MATRRLHNPYPGSLSAVKQENRNALNATGERVGDFLINYWPHVITALLGIIVGAAIAVPFLSYFGLDAIAKPIFYTLHYVCAQIPSHSFYIFGHQLGLCARNFSIYASMFVGSLIFVLSKKRLPGIPWWLWVLLILPMAVDGTTQMFGLRESSWELRLLTGTLFGLGNVLFALPLMQRSLLATTPVPPPQFTRPYAASLPMAMPGAPNPAHSYTPAQNTPLAPMPTSNTMVPTTNISQEQIEDHA
ncbi:MAG TPA: DUF2085 domain-containing protein [Ktedonobacteraceae bacterium]|nr:DUF2085 domain-containing protein [Ktedonobacteraceae bacterium]